MKLCPPCTWGWGPDSMRAEVGIGSGGQGRGCETSGITRTLRRRDLWEEEGGFRTLPHLLSGQLGEEEEPTELTVMK